MTAKMQRDMAISTYTAALYIMYVMPVALLTIRISSAIAGDFIAAILAALVFATGLSITNDWCRKGFR